MITEIESILRADDAAREGVEAAGAEAEQIRTEARELSQRIILEKQNELAAEINSEEKTILEEARSRSEALLKEAARYTAGLEDKKNAAIRELVEVLFAEATGG
jgi:cell division septum initiation protein DivIVA